MNCREQRDEHRTVNLFKFQKEQMLIINIGLKKSL